MTPAAFVFLTHLLYMSTIFTTQLKFVIGYIHTTTQKRVSQTNKSEHFIHLTSTFQNIILNKKNQTKTVRILLNYANRSYSRVPQYQCQAHSYDICNVLIDTGPIHISKLNNVLCIPETRFLQMNEMHIS